MRRQTEARRGAWGLLCGALLVGGLGGCGLTAPLPPDRPEFSQFAPAERKGTEVRLLPLRMGYQGVPRCVPAGGASCLTAVDIVHAAFIAEHPRGTFLIEAGLSSKVKDDLARFSFVEQQVFNYIPEASLKEWLERLAKAGWARPDFVLITHAHWDHTSGLVDLDHPRVILGPGEAEFVQAFPANKPPVVMANHLASAKLESFSWDGPAYENFPASHDLFGDGAVVLVPLPGHTPGSMGIFVNTVRGRRVLFVGDAAWSSDAVDLPTHKLGPLHRLTDSDPERLSESLWRLHNLQRRYPDLLIVPTHGGEAFERLRAVATTPGPG